MPFDFETIFNDVMFPYRLAVFKVLSRRIYSSPCCILPQLSLRFKFFRYTKGVDFLEILFPKKCLGCGKFGVYLCQSCISEITQGELICPGCQRASVGGMTHPICKRKFGLDGLWSLGIYEGSLKKGIQKIKYRFVRDLGKELVNLTVEYWVRNGPYILEKIKVSRGEDWVVTAVPLHKRRQNWRGFNQSELLGKLLSEKIGLKYENLLQRVKDTKPQVGLKGRDRRSNIKGAFELTNHYPLVTNILIFDDVWTTGSTMRECAYLLKRGGAKLIWGLTLAR